MNAPQIINNRKVMHVPEAEKCWGEAKALKRSFFLVEETMNMTVIKAQCCVSEF